MELPLRSVVVFGAGIVGLSVARELRARGVEVTLLERGTLEGGSPAGGASRAALGVLNLPRGKGSPLSRLLALGVAHYPTLSRELAAETGVDIGWRRRGGLHLFEELPKDAAREKLAFAFREGGFEARWLEEAQLRRLLPRCGLRFGAALHLADEAVVDPAALNAALLASCRRRGVVVRAQVGDAGLVGEPHSGARLPTGETLDADACVVAAGSWSPRVLGPGRKDAVPLTPIRGQALELRLDVEEGPNLHFRERVSGRPYYVLLQGGGRVWVGSTVEDAGFDRAATPAGQAELLAAAREVFPAAEERDIRRLWSGLRPKAMRRGGPFLGSIGPRGGLWVACGHYRSGILGGPVSASLLVRRMLGESSSPLEEELARAFRVRAR